MIQTTVIPVELCQYVLYKKQSRVFQVYILLKFIYKSGVFRLSEGLLDAVRIELRMKSIKGVRINFKKLVDLGWLRYDFKSDLYFILGYEKIQIKYGLKRCVGAEIERDRIKDFKGFLIGAVIGKLTDTQKRKSIGGVPKCGGAKQLPLLSFPVANIALSKILKISCSTAFEYKKLACRTGYIEIKKQFLPIPILKEDIQYARKVSELGAKIKVFNNKVVINGIDLVKSNVKFKRRKKIETYKVGS